MRPQSLLLAAVLAAGVVAAPSAAHAGIGIGLFIGDPTGFTIKADLQRQTALDVHLTGPWPPYDFVRMQFGT